MSAGDPREALSRNPFLVLGLPPGASRAEVEREGQRLLDALELGMAGADRYATPLGERLRGAQEVREALAELRDPERRTLHELFVSLPGASPSPPGTTPGPAPFPEAFGAMGWAGR